MDVPINQEKITRFMVSAEYILSLDLKQKKVLTKEVFEKQPEMPLELDVLRQLKVPAEKIEQVINVLLFFYDYFTERGKIELPMITVEMINEAGMNIRSMLQLLDKEGPETGWPLLEKGFKAYPEIEVLSLFTSYMDEQGVSDKTYESECCLRAGKMFLDCFIKIKKEKGEERSQEKK